MTELAQDFDVVIVGGGLVGASLALALSRSTHRVALVEAAAPPSPSALPESGPTWDERCIAVNAASQEFFATLKCWDALAPSAAPILSTHISEQGRFGVARFSAADATLPALGYNIPIREIGQQLWRLVQQTPTTLICPARVTALESLESGGASIRLTLEGVDAPGTVISTRLVVAADGAGSRVRELLRIGAQTRDYGQSAIVTAVKLAREHRGCAYERFTPEGPIALLPKPGRDCSLVWTVPSARTAPLLALCEAEFLALAQEAFGERLGVFQALGRRNAHPLSRVMSEQLSAPRVMFAGNAAQSLHPVAAQGFNLGLRDVAVIADLVGAAADPGAADVVARYAKRRERDRERVAGFTDRLVRTFSNRVPGLSGLRHLGLLALDLVPLAKETVLWQNLGYGGQAPAGARDQLR